MPSSSTIERIPGYCGLCISRCGSIAVVENGQFVALEPDPSHPTGQALCAKGRAAPELVAHPGRLRHPLKRTRPKGDPDPGWERIGWDEALDLVAANLRRLADAHGPESVAFASVSPSTSAIVDSMPWIQRLMRAFGSPNLCFSMELCGWGRLSAVHTWGVPIGLDGGAMPDFEHAGCILLWGYNPNIARLSHATAAVSARKRGARLIVVDPRRVGLANKADCWLRVRPGSDGALALGIAGVMIDRGWCDLSFIRDWTNGPLLVRVDTGNLLTERDLRPDGWEGVYLAWDEAAGGTVPYDPAVGRYERDGANPALALFGDYAVATADGGELACRPAFQLVADLCRRWSPEAVEATCWVPAEQVEAAAKLLWEARPVSYYAWSGVEQHTNVTQFHRALGVLYALTGSFDAPGGNALFPAAPSAHVAGRDLPPPRKRALGFDDRPLGPAGFGYATTGELYRAIEQGEPYPVRGLVGFGANLLLAHAEPRRGRAALAALDFYVHADLFMNPTAELADVVLPVATPFEREALKIGFEVSPEAQALVQLRRPVVPPSGEARGDTEIIFDLACRLGLGDRFWDGDIDAAYRHQLGPSGIALETLRAHPDGVRVPLTTRRRTYAEPAKERDGAPAGFATPTRKVELFSQRFRDHGYPPLPEFVEPLIGPASRPDLTARFPLVLTCTKSATFCESQHRGLPSLRKRARDPDVELHPDAAAARGIADGDWVAIETPDGSVRARALLNANLDPRVVCGQHGWWQACPEIGAPGYDPFAETGANFNLMIGAGALDPISGSVPHRSYLCEIRPSDPAEPR